MVLLDKRQIIMDNMTVHEAIKDEKRYYGYPWASLRAKSSPS